MKKKRVLIISLCAIVCVIAIGACIRIGTAKNSRREFQMEFVQDLRRIGLIATEDMPPEAMVSTVNLERDIVLNLDSLKIHLDVYYMYHDSDKKLTADEVIALYSEDNEYALQEFNAFCKWHMGEGIGKELTYYYAMEVGYYLYQEKTGEKFNGKEYKEITAEDRRELEPWVLENPDFEPAIEDEIPRNYYLNFLEARGITDPNASSTPEEVQ